MKIDKVLVEMVEHDQKNHGTKVAISNLLWLLCSELLGDIGVSGIKTTYKKEKKGLIKK